MTNRHEHDQPTPSQVWEVHHNLFTRAPVVDAWVEIEGQMQKIQPMAVKVIDQNQCNIEWSVPRAGKAGVA